MSAYVRIAFRLAALLLLQFAPLHARGESAGVFIWTTGPVHASSAGGAERAVIKGDPLAEGDTVRTGTGGLAQIRLADGGILSVRSETEWRLERFRLGGDGDDPPALLIALARGGLRSVTGRIGRLHPAGYAVTTPRGYIGIRGTDHEPWFLPEPRGRRPAGTYDRVTEGRVFLRAEDGTEMELAAGQSGFIGMGSEPPVLLDAPPEFFTGATGVHPVATPTRIRSIERGDLPAPPPAARPVAADSPALAAKPAQAQEEPKPGSRVEAPHDPDWTRWRSMLNFPVFPPMTSPDKR